MAQTVKYKLTPGVIVQGDLVKPFSQDSEGIIVFSYWSVHVEILMQSEVTSVIGQTVVQPSHS